MGGKVGWNACLLVRDVVDCVVSGEGIPVHLKMKTEILLFQGERVREFSELKIKGGSFVLISSAKSKSREKCNGI